MKKQKIFAVVLLGLLALTAMQSAFADEHRMGAWKVHIAPTCTRQGHYFSYCSHCDHWDQKWTRPLPHTPDEWVVTKEPTCSDDGTMHAHCTECGGSLRKKIDKLGHDYVVESASVQPTCTREGKGTQVCQRCGRKRQGKIDRLPHAFGEYTVTREPMGAKAGSRQATCQTCGRVIKESFHEEGTYYEGCKASNEVLRVQIMLRDLGFYKGAIKSGSFGAKTGEAVAAFQKKNGLKATKIVNADCYQRITEAWEGKTGKKAEEIDLQAVVAEAQKNAKKDR